MADICSKYHGTPPTTDNIWYISRVDPLWASSDIDVIGIDAYFPLTESKSSNISEEDIKAGWGSGEGFDYISGGNGEKHKIDPKYAWKNLRYWWENEHVNPDNSKTNWVPKSKKIWFTEYGFPSIDKAPNQPNIFFDPKCRDGGIPRGSNGNTDFAIQRKSIKATLDYWRDSEFLENLFLWTWDARPYPAWPHSSAWGDGYLWEKGHWVNGKLGGASLEVILEDLCKRARISRDFLNFVSVDKKFEGALIQGKSSILDVIQMLRSVYFFDIGASFDSVRFCGRGASPKAMISKQKLFKKEPYYLVIDLIAENQITGNISLNYISSSGLYDSKNIMHLSNDIQNLSKFDSLNLPIILSESEAKSIIGILLKNTSIEREIFNFRLSFHYIYLEPSDVLELIYEEKKYILRIHSIEITSCYMDLICVIENKDIYHAPVTASYNMNMLEIQKPAKIFVIDQPVSVSYSDYLDKNSRGLVASTEIADLYLSTDGEDFQKSHKALEKAGIGKVLKFDDKAKDCDCLIDRESEIMIYLDDSNKDILPRDQESERIHQAYISGEVVAFADIEVLDDRRYVLRNLHRNLYNSRRIEGDDNFFLLDRNVASIPSDYKFGKVDGETLDLKARADYFEHKVVDVRSDIIEDKLNISWVVRHPYIDNWKDDIPPEDLSYSIQVGDKRYTASHDHECSRQHFVLDAPADQNHSVVVEVLT